LISPLWKGGSFKDRRRRGLDETYSPQARMIFEARGVAELFPTDDLEGRHPPGLRGLSRCTPIIQEDPQFTALLSGTREWRNGLTGSVFPPLHHSPLSPQDIGHRV